MIVAITGNCGSGKSTVANYIATKYNMTQLNFSTPLKMICLAFGFKHKQLYGTQNEKENIIHPIFKISGRCFMEKVGKALSMLDKNPFIDYIEMKISEKKNESFVISDLRFQDEEKYLRSKGAVIIKVIRGNIESKKSSDKYVKKIKADYEITNNGDLKYLYSQVDKIFC